MLTAAPLGTCRVQAQAERAATLAIDLGQALRTLRQFQDDCDDCDLRPACTVSTWTAALDTAIRDIAEEWGLC